MLQGKLPGSGGKTIVTCAVTGSDDTTKKNTNVPITPKDIAQSVDEAAKAGAAICHIHVRDPETGREAKDPALFREVVDRIRQNGTNVLINLTSAIGVTLRVDLDTPSIFDDEASDYMAPEDRFVHIKDCVPDICSLDIVNMLYHGQPYLNFPKHLSVLAKAARDIGVKPEIEVFHNGDLWLARDMIADGLFADPPLIQMVLGVKYGAEATTRSMTALIDHMPDGCVWGALGIGAMEFPVLAQSVLLGGHARVGLEDNLYLKKGEPATNAQLVEHAVGIIRSVGSEVASVSDAREILGLQPR